MPHEVTFDWLLENGVVEEIDGGALIRVKAVPGAKSSEIAGVLGNRLKIRIAAPPEGGKANKAICELIARALNIRKTQVSIKSGHASAEKVFQITR